MKYGLSDKQLKDILRIFEARAEVSSVILFGSRATGTYKEASDIDFAIKGAKVSDKTISRLQNEFEDSDLPFLVDVVNYQTINKPEFKEHIDNKGVVIYRKGWRELRIDKITIIKIGRTPPRKESWWFSTSSADKKWISVKDMDKSNVYINKVSEYLTKQAIEKFNIPKIPQGTVILSFKLTVGRVRITCEDMYSNEAIVQFQIKKNVPLLTNYLFYYLKNFNYSQLGSTSSIANAINTHIIKSIPVLIPPLPEQKAIAEVLSSLDDKIDLLHRQNKTLEDIAQALFRKWFVEDADEGWEEVKLSNLVDHKKVNIRPSKSLHILFDYYSIPAFDNKKNPVKKIGGEIKSNKYKVFKGSILVSKLNPKFPRVWPIIAKVNKYSICSTEFQVVLPKENSLFGFIYYFLNSKTVTKRLIGASGGTSGSHQRVKSEDIFNLKIKKPTNDATVFSEVTKKFLLKTFKNQQQIRTLENLRDIILPKLMSGKVKVKS